MHLPQLQPKMQILPTLHDSAMIANETFARVGDLDIHYQLSEYEIGILI
jgi:hypothetical protein